MGWRELSWVRRGTWSEERHPLAQQLGCGPLQELGKPRNTSHCNIPLCLGSDQINTSFMLWVKQ